jgi:hypothetical protein
VLANNPGHVVEKRVSFCSRRHVDPGSGTESKIPASGCTRESKVRRREIRLGARRCSTSD